MNETYLVNDKTAFDEIEAFALAPSDFRRRLDIAFLNQDSTPGAPTADRLGPRVQAMEALVVETIARAGNLYTPKWALRGR